MYFKIVKINFLIFFCIFKIRICKQKDLNGNNSDEIRFRMVRVKRRILLKQLLAHYLLPYCRLYRSRIMIKSHSQQINFD